MNEKNPCKLSTLILEKDNNLPKSLVQKLLYSAEKVIIIDGSKYDVIKNRHGMAMKNGHVNFIHEELYNKYD